MAWSVDINGLASLDDLLTLDKRTRSAAARALNATATRTRTTLARRVRDQVALPASYVAPRNGRLSVSKKANPTQLEAVITARSRPTSLSRFLLNKPKRGVEARLQVTPGRLTRIPRAFLIRLRAGNQLTDTRFNLGLAIRLRPGETLLNKKNVIRTRSGLYLLYGPSVQQVILDNQQRGLAREVERPTADFLEREFLRLINL